MSDRARKILSGLFDVMLTTSVFAYLLWDGMGFTEEQKHKLIAYVLVYWILYMIASLLYWGVLILWKLFRNRP